ncbi:ribosomal protein S18-alanine N-acetyltransferase [Kangiella marina]|uniref:[Ribosomal protein bS18]-alanine N-acetyltransferase n=1 Tax=Kangiella marina TaxID=1079178 RepID=A0ABP8IEV1_9GAMM
MEFAPAITLMPLESIIRPLEATDLEQLVAIEQDAHEHPWKESIHLSCIEQEYPSLVLEIKGGVVAYVVFNYLYDECNLMNITTTPKLQGRGYASQLMHSLYQHSKQAGMKSVLLEVRESNQPALSFYRKEGFEEIGRRSSYYPKDEQREDAVVMRRSLDELPSTPTGLLVD